MTKLIATYCQGKWNISRRKNKSIVFLYLQQNYYTFTKKVLYFIVSKINNNLQWKNQICIKIFGIFIQKIKSIGQRLTSAKGRIGHDWANAGLLVKQTSTRTSFFIHIVYFYNKIYPKIVHTLRLDKNCFILEKWPTVLPMYTPKLNY